MLRQGGSIKFKYLSGSFSTLHAGDAITTQRSNSQIPAQGASLRDWYHTMSCVCGERLYSQGSRSTQTMHEVMSSHGLRPAILFMK